MIEQSATLIGQAILLALLAGWLSLGCWGNWRHPSINHAFVAEVMSMAPLRQEQPDLFEQLGRYRVECPRRQARLYRAIVATQTACALLLWAGVAALVAAALGAVDPGAARALAMLAAAGFTAIWGAFLIGGEWFSYWTAFGDSQRTHFLLAIWGAASFAALH